MAIELKNIVRASVLFLLVFTLVTGYLSILGCGQVTLPPRRPLEVNVSGNCVNEEVIINTTDRNDNPISKVRIEVYFDRAVVEEILTDSGGMASFIPVYVGGYEIKLMKSGYKGQEVSLSVIYCGSCSDGILNQGEIGVDCGGPCPPCPQNTSTTTSTSTTSTTTTSTTPSSTTTSTTTALIASTTLVTTTSSTTTLSLAEESDGLDVSLLIILFVGFLVLAGFYVLYTRTRRLNEDLGTIEEEMREKTSHPGLVETKGKRGSLEKVSEGTKKRKAKKEKKGGKVGKRKSLR